MWYGFFAPKGTPAEVVERLNKEVAAILGSPEAKAVFEAQGLIPATSTPAALGEIVVRDRTRWADVVAKRGIPAGVSDQPDVLIVGGGIGGLALALSLHQAGISARVFEAAPEVLPLGVGINLLPHAMRELSELGLQEALAAQAIETRELAFYSRHGQFIYKEPRGRFAGYDWPQLSIHRADLHKVLLDATRAAARRRVPCSLAVAA